MPVITARVGSRETAPLGPKSVVLNGRAARRPPGTSVIAAAATVAIRARRSTTSPCPSGCRRLDKTMTNVRLDGSIQSDVPVKPVCPNDPSGSKSPRLEERLESMSQPRPRRLISRAGVAGAVILAIVNGARIRLPETVPPDRSIRQKIVRSAAVLNRPACPATPPIRRAVGSWTSPRSIVAPGPPQGQPSGVQGSVGAIRDTSEDDGLNIVSCMPSGSKIRR